MPEAVHAFTEEIKLSECALMFGVTDLFCQLVFSRICLSLCMLSHTRSTHSNPPFFTIFLFIPLSIYLSGSLAYLERISNNYVFHTDHSCEFESYFIVRLITVNQTWIMYIHDMVHWTMRNESVFEVVFTNIFLLPPFH